MDKYLDRIKGLSKQDLMDIYNSVNKWEWHDALGKKPDNWDVIPNFMLNSEYKLPTKYDITREIIKYITSVVSERDILKNYHIKQLGRTEKEFRVWWMKRWFKRTFRLGMWSKKNQDAISKIAKDIAESNKNEWVKKTFGKGD